MKTTNKENVKCRHPKAYCRMSHLSGMFFVYSGRAGKIISYEPSVSKAWSQAAKKLSARSQGGKST